MSADLDLAAERVAWPCPIEACDWEFDTPAERVEHVRAAHTCPTCGQALDK
jgi:hypothetical protein